MYADRIDALAGRLDRPLLVTSLVNIRYLTGFGGSSAYLLVRPDAGAVFLTDGRYGETAERLLAAIPSASLEVATSGIWDRLAGILEGGGELSLEAHDVSWDVVETLRDRTDRQPVATTGLVEELRRTKGPSEVAALRAAAAAGDAAFGAVRTLVA